jgi:hypothetical protein
MYTYIYICVKLGTASNCSQKTGKTVMYVLVPRRLRKPFTLVKIFDKWGRANEHAVSHLAYRFDSLSHDGRGIWPDRVSENGKDHFREKNGFSKKNYHTKCTQKIPRFDC